MTMRKKDDYLLHQSSIKVPHFYRNQRNRFIFRHFMLKKSLKRFITEYIHKVKTIMS